MNKALFAAAMTMFGLTAGCAHNPNLTVGYYLPHTKVDVKVTRIVACTAGAEPQPIVGNTVIVTPMHAADFSARKTVNSAALNGHFSDSDLKLDFFEDGRLKSINTASTGQGEQIIKTAISLATTLAPILFVKGGIDYSAECTIVKKASGGKTLTLTFEKIIDISDSGTVSEQIYPDATSAFYADSLPKIIGTVRFEASDVKARPAALVAVNKMPKGVALTLRQPGAIHAKVTAGAIRNPAGDLAWEDDLPIAQRGVEYDLAIPGPVTFGKETLLATFEESGALTSLHYTSESGTGQALSVVNAAFTPFQPSAKADRIKAEADLIAQQQRLIQCQADPQNCK